MRFIRSRGLSDRPISADNIFISLKGEVKIGKALKASRYCRTDLRREDYTTPNDGEHTSTNSESLGTLMLRMMNETRESLATTTVSWSAEALDFVKATSLASPDELSDVSSSAI